jgi:hypothetical protein
MKIIDDGEPGASPGLPYFNVGVDGRERPSLHRGVELALVWVQHAERAASV